MADDLRFAIVVSQFNAGITDGLLRGAQAGLAESQVASDAIRTFSVPGAFEIPSAAQRLAESGEYDAIICLGCLIKGETMHFEYIAQATSNGIQQAALATGVPMGFGVLTTLTEHQAIERSSDDSSNKGREAALAAFAMATLFKQLDDEGPQS